MDEISRELPPDTTTPRTSPERSKGPDELVAFERGRTAEDDLVVNDPGPNQPGANAPAPNGVPLPSAREIRLRRDPGEDSSPIEMPTREAAEEAGTGIDPGAAAAAVAAEADTVEIDEDLAFGEDEGLPAVPELVDAAAVAKVVFVLMLTSREGLSLLRLAQACNTTQKLIEEALALLQADLRGLGLPVELARSGDAVKWMSGPESFAYLQRLRGVKKLEKLSPAALETLAVIAYRQPVMRSEVEAIRGVKAGPMLRTLLHHKLVKVTGRADVPGRPLQYGTTQQFLERFGIASLQELPSVKEWKSLG